MGQSCLSVHVRGTANEIIVDRVTMLAVRSGTAAYVSQGPAVWTAVYPNAEFMDAVPFAELLETLVTEHIIVVRLVDSDVLEYWYARNGEVVDHYNSCPDYYGEADEDESEAVGNPDSFAELLDESARKKMAALLSPRMIDGESIGGEVPDFEDERLIAFAALFDLQGILGSFEAIEAGEHVAGLNAANRLVRVE